MPPRGVAPLAVDQHEHLVPVHPPQGGHVQGGAIAGGQAGRVEGGCDPSQDFGEIDFSQARDLLGSVNVDRYGERGRVRHARPRTDDDLEFFHLEDGIGRFLCQHRPGQHPGYRKAGDERHDGRGSLHDDLLSCHGLCSFKWPTALNIGPASRRCTGSMQGAVTQDASTQSADHLSLTSGLDRFTPSNDRRYKASQSQSFTRGRTT